MLREGAEQEGCLCNQCCVKIYFVKIQGYKVRGFVIQLTNTFLKTNLMSSPQINYSVFLIVHCKGKSVQLLPDKGVDFRSINVIQLLNSSLDLWFV